MFEENRRRRRFRDQRQLYDKARAHGTIFLNANRAMVIFYDAADNRKPKPGSAFLCREVRGMASRTRRCRTGSMLARNRNCESL